MRSLLWIIACGLVLCGASACREEHKERVGDIKDEANTPTMATTNVSTFISDSGYTRYHITADLWYIYDQANPPYWTFPDGLFLERYDDNFVADGTFQCDSATFLSQRKLWQFDGNVRMRNNDGDKFLTQQLFWDQNSHKLYCDSFIHIEKSDRVLEGIGFISNENLTDYTIRRPQGIFPVKEPERNDTVTANPDSVRASRRAQQPPIASTEDPNAMKISI